MASQDLELGVLALGEDFSLGLSTGHIWPT